MEFQMLFILVIIAQVLDLTIGTYRFWQETSI